MKNYDIVNTKWGFKSVSSLPAIEELEKHYSEKYYQNDCGSYTSQYDSEELKYFDIAATVSEYLYKKYIDRHPGKLLDVGAGEGFFSGFFYKNGWKIKACDFSDHGVKTHNPEIKEFVVTGNIFETLHNEQIGNEKYNLVNLKNVLEHVIDPESLLVSIKSLMDKKSVLRIEVPNDYSDFQNFLLEKNLTKNTWFCPPEHLHYFTLESLVKFVEDIGFRPLCAMSDFPIELYQLNPYSNYALDKSLGKKAHMARVMANNYIFDQGIDAYITYFKASIQVCFGRQIILFLIPV